MMRRQPRSTLTDTLCPYTTLVRSRNADAAFSGGKTACAGDIGPLYRERVHPAGPRRHPAFGRNYYAGHMSAFSAPTEDARHGTPTLAERYRALRARSIALAAPLTAADAIVQSMPAAHPAKPPLAHTTWFFERFVLGARDGQAPADGPWPHQL